MADTFIVHTNELVLKGNNRSHFEKRLIDNLMVRLPTTGAFRLARRDGSVLLFGAGRTLTDREEEAAREAGRRTFGVATYLLAQSTARELAAIKETAAALAVGHQGTFKVETRRRDKRYPMPSMEVSREVGGHLLSCRPDLRVDVHAPTFIVYVEIDYSHAYVAVGTEAGPGGLPTGVSGQVTALLSGGIDSPVAAWKLMRRGCEATLVHCHSYPYVGRESLSKAERLAEQLAAWQGPTRLWFVPLADAQRAIAAKADESLRVVLYRRLMLRAAERLTASDGSLGLVTGDAVGQVASQTLVNLACVSEAATMPIYRPLIGEDKNDIIALARRLGTYDISVEKHDDCCSLFMPASPATHARLADVRREEAALGIEELTAAVVAAAELKTIGKASRS